MDDYSRFYRAYENYSTHAFPHEELKPLTKSFTDSLRELGNLKILQTGWFKDLTRIRDLGRRFLPAFNTPTGLPYAWINLKM
ncbi:hypothetical protein LWI29_012500 [Acer saccharum]|uniref:Uncharacterized protein n=1 Tax=Acer saccharum TaxID=4024 RepID=A0AA39VQM3_ACESA|nr:hypothetical protein LWI29_012500 [Acer saccharum]